MRKYPAGEQVVEAIYDNAPVNNPLLAAMPEMLSRDEFMVAIRSMPPLPHMLPQMSPEERRQSLPLLSTVFIPLDYMYYIYDQLYRAIRMTYTTRSGLVSVRGTNALSKGTSISMQADSGSILGVAGIGKTSTIKRCLGLLPQTIEHTEYQGHSFFGKQVLYLHIECPGDCSVKTLAFNILAALDRAVGSSYLERLTLMRSVSISAIATQAKILCMTHNVALILVDEIQNVISTARKSRQTKPLIKFLVELTNDAGTATYFIGTPEAEELFISQEHLKRRTRGIRLLPMKPDGVYHFFLGQLWPNQLTVRSAQMTDKMVNKIYDHSAGVPAYIVKIFQEAQVQALLAGVGCINEKLIQRAVDILAIKVPRTFSGGTHISDFNFVLDVDTKPEGIADSPAMAALPEDFAGTTAREVPRLYANRRGRPVVERDDTDLLLVYKAGTNLLEYLRSHDLMEVFAEC